MVQLLKFNHLISITLNIKASSNLFFFHVNFHHANCRGIHEWYNNIKFFIFSSFYVILIIDTNINTLTLIIIIKKSHDSIYIYIYYVYQYHVDVEHRQMSDTMTCLILKVLVFRNIKYRRV